MSVDTRSAGAVLITAAVVLGVVLASSACGSDGGQLEVSVQFSADANQDEMEEVGAFLRMFDDDLEFVILEIFPPIGRAAVTTDDPDFCKMVATKLVAESYVDGVSCGPKAGGLAEPDALYSIDSD